MCAMGKPTPGSKLITPRFSRHFSFYCIDEFDDVTLKVIFCKIMLWHLDTRLDFPYDIGVFFCYRYFAACFYLYR